MVSPAANDDATEELLALSQVNDASILTGFFQRYSAKLERIVQLRLHPALKGRIDACDIVQEVFVQAINGLERYLETKPMPVFLWLRKLLLQSLTQAHRRHLNAQRRDIRRERDIQDVPPANSGCIAMELSAGHPTPSRIVSQKETEEKLQAALDALPEADREILALWHFEQLSGPEVAIVLGITHEAAKKRHVRALAKLRSAGGFA